MKGAAFAALFIAVASIAHGAELPWHSSPQAALAVARAQKKLLFIEYRGACTHCNDRFDAMFAAAPDDDVFMHTLDSYVPLRITARSAAADDPIFQALAAEAPLLALYDGSGAQLLLLDRRTTWSEFVEELLRFRGQRERIVRSVELRRAGLVADADLTLGNSLIMARASMQAADRLERAAKAYREQKAPELAQIAEALSGGAWYMSGFRPKGRKIVNEVLSQPVSDAAAAEAYVVLASQLESDAAHVGPVLDGMGRPRQQQVRDQRSLAKAIEAYRKAYAMAPLGSQALVFSRLALQRLDDQPLPRRKTERRTSLRIVAPARKTLIGDSEFHLDATEDIARADFYLDDVKVGSSNKDPFRVTIDVGRVPSVRTVKAIAFDADGTAKGEATITINDRMDAFSVSVIEPASSWPGGESDVELDVQVPPGKKLSRVDLSWNGKPVETLTAAPFRSKLSVPEKQFGYLRAVALLDDGTTTETTKVYNSTGLSESVDVGVVNVIATVSDKEGNRIGGLTTDDFSIRDEGQTVTPTLRSSDDDPVLIGIAVDSSSSMGGRQLYVIRAATQFLAHALRPQDQAFVASFDTGARLVHARSSDATSLRESVYGLTPQGGTSIFDGVTFALQQFQGINGKKALVVFSDGREGTSSASARECERLARTVGVPIYVIVPPARDQYRNALLGLASLTGGAMFNGEPVETFPALFDRLAAEIRGQYVLSFTRPAEVKSGSWRTIRVSVSRRDANVRTIQGYRAN